jgi:membrane-associated phospholipid phosphatase
VVQSTSVRARVRLKPVRPDGWWLDALLLLGFVAVTVGLIAGTVLLDLDVAVRDWCDEHRPDWAYWTARVLNYAGQGGPITLLCLGIGGYLAWRRHTVRPILPVIVGFLLTFFTVGPLKVWSDRPAGTLKSNSPELFAGGLSYPSGHVVNAIVWYTVLTLLVGRNFTRAQRLALRLGPPLLVLGTTTYLSWHWLTDGVAALMLGLVLERLVRRIPWDDVPLGRGLAGRGWSGPSGIEA